MAGTLPLGSIDAGTGFVFLTARNGAITDANGASVNLTAANGVSLTTTGNSSAIGTAADAIETKIGTLNATTFDGGIFIADSNAPGMIINNVVTREGGFSPFIDGSNQIVIDSSSPHAGVMDVVISAQGDILLNTLSAPDLAMITSVGGRILDINQASNNVIAQRLTLAAQGTIGQNGDAIELTAEAFSAGTTSGSIILAPLLAGTAVSVVAGGVGNDVSIAAAVSDLRIQTISAPGDVTVANSFGSLLDDNGAAVNLTGQVVDLTGKTGIGTAADPLETAAADLRVAVAGAADALILTGTGQKAGTFTLNGGIPISFSGVDSFAYNAGDMDDTTTVSPFATSVLPWNVAVTIDGGTGTDRITYNNVAGLLDSTAVTATAAQAGHIDSPGVTSALNSQLVSFTHVENLTVNANPGEDEKLTVNLRDTGAADTANLLFDPTARADDLQLVGLFNMVIDTDNYVGLTLNGRGGDDTFNVTPGPIPVFVDGGDPIGSTAGDTINFNPAAAYVVEPGPQNDEGGLGAAGARRVSWDRIEAISVSSKGPGVLLGTNGNDIITIVARDSSFDARADGVRDFTVSLNSGPSILFLNTPVFRVEALAGNDDIELIADIAGWNVPGMTLSGNVGNDVIHAATGAGSNSPITLDGGAGDDLLEGGAGDDRLLGGDGQDTVVAGPGSDMLDGGTGFDTVLIRGTAADDIIDVFQIAPAAAAGSGYVLDWSLNGVAQPETITQDTAGSPRTAGTRPTVEEVRIEAGLGNDLIRVGVSDAYSDLDSGNGAPNQSLRFNVLGDAPNSTDRLVVRDDGLGDRIALYQGPDQRSGRVSVAPGVTIAGGGTGLADVIYQGIARLDLTPLDPVTSGTGTDGMGRVVVFHPDPNEVNDSRLNAGQLPRVGQNVTSPSIAPGGLTTPFSTNGDEDWYEFRPTATNTFEIRILFDRVQALANGRAGLPGGGDLSLDIYDANGVLITSGVADAGGNNRTATFAATNDPVFPQFNRIFVRVKGAGAQPSLSINRYDFDNLSGAGSGIPGASAVDANGPQVTGINIANDPLSLVDESAYNVFVTKPTEGPTPLGSGDAVHHDNSFTFGLSTDTLFAGNFAAAGAFTANGYDKLGAYGKVGGTSRFLLDLDGDGQVDYSKVSTLQISGLPVAGDFAPGHPGQQIGLVTSKTWYLDTNGNNDIDPGDLTFPNVLTGLPIVGDFDGDGIFDLGAFNVQTDTFSFDLGYNGHGQLDATINFGFPGVRDLPVAADMNQDGVTDIGLFVPRSENSSETLTVDWYFLVSQGTPTPGTVSTLNHAFNQTPFSNDRYFTFGDSFFQPIVGNFDPPVAGDSSGIPPVDNGSPPPSGNGGQPSDGNVVADPSAPPAASPGLVGVPQFAVGSGTGGPATVTVYNPDRSVAMTFDPFPETTGGVRTAVADFNGDGTPGVAAGAGPGAAAQVKILDGKTGAVLFDAHPYADFTGGVFVPAGDLTGDGQAELVVTPDEGGGPRVMVYRGGDFVKIADFLGIEDPEFRGGARAALGDLNGDGFADLVISAGFGGGPRVSVYDGQSLAQDQLVHAVPDFFLFEQSLRNGAYVAVGDVDGDGFADIIGGAGPGGAPRVLVISGQTLLSAGSAAAMDAPVANFFAGDVTNRGGIRVAAKNLDGDARADLVVGDGEGGSRLRAYAGVDFGGGAAPELFAFDPVPGSLNGVFVG